MWQFALFASLVVGAFLWPTRHHRPWITRLIAGLALALAAALWCLVAFIAGQPRGPVALDQPATLIFGVLATDDAGAYLDAGEHIVRVSLPEGRIVGRLPLGPDRLGVVTGVASNGQSLLYTYHHGPENAGWALLDGTRWLVMPHKEDGWNGVATPDWDASQNRYVVSQPEAFRPDITRLRRLFVAGDGQRLGSDVLQLRANGWPPALCHVGAALWATPGFAQDPPCRIGPVDPEGAVCRPDMSMKGLRVSCPGMLRLALHDPQHDLAWLSESGVQRVVMPPAAVIGQGVQPVGAYLAARVTADGLEPDIQWYHPKPGFVRWVRDRFVVSTLILEDEARKRGHAPEAEIHVQTLDRQGRPLAEDFVYQPWSSWLMFVAGDELVLLSNQLHERARFDLKTLERRDAPSAIENVRQHLANWGGPSGLFDGILAACLLLAPLTLILLGWSLWRPRAHPGQRVTPLRLALIYWTFALPTLIATIRCYWYL